MASRLFATKPVDELVADTEDEGSHSGGPSACWT